MPAVMETDVFDGDVNNKEWRKHCIYVKNESEEEWLIMAWSGRDCQFQKVTGIQSWPFGAMCVVKVVSEAF